ncbi:MAG: hypothetical protein Q8R44_04735 [Novosphingobium sp.]|nr:hypothetical protein [Novosphingobium sp.]
MSTFAITYDLRRPGKDYTTLIKVISSLPGAVHYQQSAWFVRWTGTASSLRDFLRPYLDANDLLMVMQVTAAAWHPNLACDAKIKQTFALAA